MHICIGCHVLSNHTLGNIKFQSPDGNLLAWLKKECIFIESDNLGTDQPVMIRHFTKIDSTLTHLACFHNHFANQLMLVDIDADTAVKLTPYLKLAQLEAMMNGDNYVPILPEFEIYRTCLSHGRVPSQVMMDILGIKYTPHDAKLMNKFLTHVSSKTNHNQWDGVFIPKGTSSLTWTANIQANLEG